MNTGESQLITPPQDPLARALARLTPRYQKLYLRKVRRNGLKKFARAQLRLTPSPEGYCCPKCWEWYGTPAERKQCRENHRRAAE